MPRRARSFPTRPPSTRVLFDVNPSQNPDVPEIKTLCAALIETMKARPSAVAGPARARAAAIAITAIEGAQMRAVNALFAK